MIMIETCTFFNLCALHRNFQLRQRSMVHLTLMWQLPLKMEVNAQQVILKKRSPKSEMKKGIKLPERELNSNLVALIDAG